MVKCPVCGQPYGVTHSCPGPPAPSSALATNWPVPDGFAPVRYFRQAIAIARLNDDAIIAASLDPWSLAYGAVIWLIGQLLVLGGALRNAFSHNPVRHNPAIYGIVFIVALILLLVADVIWELVKFGVCHLLARWLFDGRGTYIRLLRPLLLGSVVLWLVALPYVGMIVGGLWFVAVMMMVFEDVEGIERLKAFGLALAVGSVFYVLVRLLLPLR